MSDENLELTKAFKDFQEKKAEVNLKIKKLESGAVEVEKGKRTYELTETITSEMPPDTRFYRSVGRMFVLTDASELHADLKDKHEKCVKALEHFERTKESLKNEVKEQEEALRQKVQKYKDTSK